MGNTFDSSFKCQSYQLTSSYLGLKDGFFFEDYSDFNHASSEDRLALISQIYPVFSSIMPKLEDFIDIIQSYFYNPLSINTSLVLFKSTADEKVLGFAISYEFLLPFFSNDSRNENLFIVLNGYCCIEKSARRLGIQRKCFNYRYIEDIHRYPRNNIVHFDVSTNPLSYLVMCITSKLTYPRKAVQKNDYLDEIMSKAMQATQYERCDSENPYLVRDSFADYSEISGKYQKETQRFNDDIKFFIEQTGFKDLVGLAIFSVIQLVKGNTLRLPEGRYLAEDCEVNVKKYECRKPKI
jgi:hypothetical protein